MFKIYSQAVKVFAHTTIVTGALLIAITLIGYML